MNRQTVFGVAGSQPVRKQRQIKDLQISASMQTNSGKAKNEAKQNLHVRYCAHSLQPGRPSECGRRVTCLRLTISLPAIPTHLEKSADVFCQALEYYVVILTSSKQSTTRTALCIWSSLSWRQATEHSSAVYVLASEQSDRLRQPLSLAQLQLCTWLYCAFCTAFQGFIPITDLPSMVVLSFSLISGTVGASYRECDSKSGISVKFYKINIKMLHFRRRRYQDVSLR